MAASLTDKLMKVGVAGTLTQMASPGKALGASSFNVGSGSNYPTDTGFIVAVREVDNDGAEVAGTYTEWIATISGTTLTINATPVYGNDQVYAAGANTQVFIPVSAYAHNTLIDALLEEHKQTGAHSDITADSLVVANNIDMADGKAIRDGNDNELLEVEETASAVNHLGVKNAATSNAPQIQAKGSDTNIDADIVPKGTGRVTKNQNNIDSYEEIGRTTLGSAGDTISVQNLPARKYLKVIINPIRSGSISLEATFNNDSDSNYATDALANFSVTGGASNASNINLSNNASEDKSAILEIVNEAAREKQVYGWTYESGGAGEGNPPDNRLTVGKWDNTSDQISRIDVLNSGAGDFAIGSEVIVLGHN